MNNLKILAAAGIFITAAACSRSNGSAPLPSPAESNDTIVREQPLPEAVEIDPVHANAHKADTLRARRALLAAYPDFIAEVGANRVTFTDGSTMEFDDDRPKDWQTLLDECDIEDMFYAPYASDITPPRLHDPGRTRCTPLFEHMYGATAAEVRANLEPVEWFGSKVQFTRINGAADSLRRVADELARHPELKAYLASSGTFNWRAVRGARRMSAHSYGIAIDVGVALADYWLWAAKTTDELAEIPYRNRMPRAMVGIFERHGFIWGGAWYHFDTMHFEFRPELLRYAESPTPADGADI